MTQKLPSETSNKLFPPIRLSLLGFLFTTLLFYPFLLQGQSYCDGDLSIFTLPQFQFISQLMNDSTLPAWNPFLGSGQPLIGDSSMPIFYPLNVLHCLLDPITTLNIFLIVHLYLAFLGTYALARTLRISAFGASLAALSFSFGGIGLSQLTTPMYCFGIPWFLWTLTFFLQSLAPENSLRKQALAALSLTLLVLSGSLDYILSLLALCLIFGLFQKPSPKVMLRPLCKSFLSLGVLSIGMSSCVLAPMLLLLPETVRDQGLSYLEASKWSLAPIEWLSLVVPFPFEEGGLQYREFSAQPRPWFFSLHMGVIPFIFALCAVCFSARKFQVRPALLTILVFLPFASGSYSPVYRALFDLLPFLSRSRYPAKYFVPVALSLALLSAIGFDWWCSLDQKWKRLNKLVVIVAVILISGVATSFLLDKVPLTQRLLVPTIALLCLAATQIQKAIKIEKLILAIIFLELLICSQFFVLFCPRILVSSPPQIGRILKEQERKTGAASIVSISPKAPITTMRIPEIKTTNLPLLFFASRQSLKANSGMPYGLRTTPAFSPLQLKRPNLLKKALDQSTLDQWGKLQRMGVQHYIFTPFDYESPPAEIRELGSYGPWKVGRLKKNVPWAAVLPRRGKTSTLPEALEAISEESFLPEEACIIEGSGVSATNILNANQQIRILRFEFDRIELSTKTNEGGFLVIQESYSKGWSATVDGEATTIYPANVQFRGVYVPKGSHKVSFQYHCPAWNWALPLSLTTFAVTLLLILVSFLPGKRQTPPGHPLEASAENIETPDSTGSGAVG